MLDEFRKGVTMTRDWVRMAGEAAPGDRPLLVVHGNCQAESLRVLATAALGDEVKSVRVPPVFEFTAEQIGDLQALLARTSFLVTQPIVDDYHGLPLGHRQIARWLPASARVAVVPALRWAALHPTHAIVRAPGVGDPPAVPYHDLRTLTAAARGDTETDLSQPSAEAVRAVRDISREQLRIRQDHHETVDAIACFEAAGAEATWTINHPQNRVLRTVAEAVLHRLGLARPVADPGRVLLSATLAPVRASALAALGLMGEARDGWLHQGRALNEAEVGQAQLAWYNDHPAIVAAGLHRHRETIEALGLRA